MKKRIGRNVRLVEFSLILCGVSVVVAFGLGFRPPPLRIEGPVTQEQAAFWFAALTSLGLFLVELVIFIIGRFI